jgi:hypothetical protein
MTRRGTSRLPGELPAGDEQYGALGGFVDDVTFWIRDRERSHEIEAAHMERLARAGSRPRRLSRIEGILARVRRC